MNAKDTFLIDTTTGDVWELVEDKNQNELWQKMGRQDEYGFPMTGKP
jgi:hypothetical protein